jgi:hypothetical protein
VLTGPAQEKARKPLRPKKSSQETEMPETSPLTRTSSTSRKNEGDKNDEQQILTFLKNDRLRPKPFI